MKLEEYGSSVVKKAEELIKNNQVVTEWPLTDEQVLNEKNQWRFMILYGKDKKKENGYYVDKDGNYGNLVYYLMKKDIWTCTCMHYRLSLSENCKHICGAKIRMEKLIKDAKERIKSNSGGNGGVEK